MNAKLSGLRIEGREDSHEKHPVTALRMEFEDEAVAMLYGTLVGAPNYVRDKGIQMVFEAVHPKGWKQWCYARWCVTLEGNDLKDLYNHLCASKLVYVRIGENVTSIDIEEAEVTVGQNMGRGED